MKRAAILCVTVCVSACVAEVGEIGVVTGAETAACATNDDCDATGYCAKPVGGCAGAGVCEPRPTACIAIFDPVCGCDGRTYGNACEAAAGGTSVSHRGECRANPYPEPEPAPEPQPDPDPDPRRWPPPPPEPVPACTTNDDCDATGYCAKPVGGCAGAGVCEPRPTACIAILDPVCGCDGRTYGNACEAAAGGTSVSHRGGCREDALPRQLRRDEPWGAEPSDPP